MKYIFYIFIFLSAACNTNSKQDSKPVTDQPFGNDIQKFKKQDSVSFPPKNAILFIGSSSFTKWTDVQDYFPGYTIINRGFGGSTLLDQIRYVNDIVFPYEPKQIVIYCGENDLASSDTVSSTVVSSRFIRLYKTIREKLPDVHITYISMKPSPSRRHLFYGMKAGNLLIEHYVTYNKNSSYIDVHSKMLNEAGQPMPDIFLEDSLHMNAKGYAIWKKEIEPYLIK
jgi:lysophospholipase L1-like esterase